MAIAINERVPPLAAGDRYQLLSPDAGGLWRSRIFPGLWLDGQALLGGNLWQVLDRLQDGLRSAEHEQFVTQLASRR
jgi:hypothetical protein